MPYRIQRADDDAWVSRVFLYGTLRTGERNHKLIQELVRKKHMRSEGEVNAANMGLVIFDGLPCAYLCYGDVEGGLAPYLVGEMYLVTDYAMRMLDKFEGHPHFFKRYSVAVEGGKKACIYGGPSFRIGQTDDHITSFRVDDDIGRAYFDYTIRDEPDTRAILEGSYFVAREMVPFTEQEEDDVEMMEDF